MGSLLLLATVWLASVASHELCLNTQAPQPVASGTLSFCSSMYEEGPTCCDATSDAALQTVFNALQINAGSYPECADFIASVSCAQCDPFAAHLFDLEDVHAIRPVPWLCPGYCALVYNACHNVPIYNSPFNPAQLGSRWPLNTTYTLSTNYPTAQSFCQATTPVHTQYCFNGEVYTLNTTAPPTTSSDLVTDFCMEKVIHPSGTVLTMVPHPDGSGKLALGTRDGRILLYANAPTWDRLDSDAQPFFDISEQGLVTDSGEMAFLSFAFHPDYMNNGRLFVSYSCRSCRTAWTCDKGCEFSTCDGSNHCGGVDHVSVVSEYRVANMANIGTNAERIDSSNAHQDILTLAQPYGNHNGGQILFGPADGGLYVMFGDGGSGGDPLNLALNMQVLLGKILRLDVDATPDAGKGYHVPVDNPFTSVTLQGQPVRGEIWAFGLRNPWRCSFDHDNALWCGDVGQGQWEEVSLIQRGGNYGWNRFEGFNDYSSTPIQNIPAFQLSPHIVPLVAYPHNPDHRQSPDDPYGLCVIGGHISNSPIDMCNNGKYLFADLQGLMYVGSDFTGDGEPSANLVRWHCAAPSHLYCHDPQGRQTDNSGLLPQVGSGSGLQVYSFAEDNHGVVFVLAGDVFRVVNQTMCGFACNVHSASMASVVQTPSMLWHVLVAAALAVRQYYD